MTKYNVSPLVAREMGFYTGTIFGGSWCRYFISITLHQCYIEATWKTRPKNDLDGNKEIFNSLQEYQYTATYNALEKWASDKSLIPWLHQN